VTELKRTLERLYGLIGRGRKLGLERMEAACQKLGHPERSFKVVHVTGTNGKGTVSAFIASMLKASGAKTGLYTSPHLNRFAERIQINGEPIRDEQLVTLLNRVMDEAPDATFFEVATLTAFLAFQEAQVDTAVLEVGLGGRLDATNVVPSPELAIVTRVAFDHMAELGDSLGKIAFEKAGIIKAGTRVVLGKLHPEAETVITQKAKAEGAEILPLGSPEPIPGAPLAYPRFAMIGTNLAVATTAARALGLSPEKMAEGIESLSWPGRNELLHRNGQELTLLDCAHNPDGTVALSHALDPSMLGEIESRREIVLVFGAIDTKNYRAMLKRLEHVAPHRVFVRPPVKNAVDPALLAQVLKGETANSVADALARARSIVGQKGVVVVTGSTFLVGAARAQLLSLPTDPAIDL
jgi:dihydrofolate synthase/folylpolyglutamate synthase